MASASASLVGRSVRRVRRGSKAAVLAAAVAGVLALGGTAHAVDFIWDADGSTSAATGGNGDWNTTGLNWNNGTAFVAWPTVTPSTTVAVFGGTPGTVNATTGLNVNGLKFDVDGYTLSGSTLTFSGTTPTITVTSAGHTANVGNVLAGAPTGGLIKAGSGTLVLTGTNTWTNGVTVNGGLLEAIHTGAFPLNAAGPIGNGGNMNINNGATLRLTTPAGSALLTNNAASRTVAFGANGGVLDLNGRISSNGAANWALNLGNTAGNVAVVRFNGGDYGLSNTGNTQDWQTGGNMLRFNAFAGAGAGGLRVELLNGAAHRLGVGTPGSGTGGVANTQNIAVNYTVRGVVGGDPSSGPTGVNHTGTSQNYGRIGLDNGDIFNMQGGLFLEDALAVAPLGNNRAIDGNITVRGSAGGHAGHVAFFGRSTGTAMGNTVMGLAGDAGVAGHYVLFLGRDNNDTLTVEDGGIAALDSRVRSDQGNHGGVLLNSRSVIQGGGKLVFRQSISNVTPGLTPAPASASLGWHIVQGNIQGEGATAKESVVDLYLPFKNTGGTQLGGVEFQSTSNLVVNGTGLGGLRVNGLARPNALFGAAADAPTADPVSNAAKVSNLLTASRLAALTGSGGYLTAAPQGATFEFPNLGDWAESVPVGLRVVNNNTAGDNVDVRMGGNFKHSIHLDAGSLFDANGKTLGPSAATANLGRITGTGTIAGGAVLDGGAVLAPNDTGTGTIRATGGFTLNGAFEFDALTPNSRDVLAVTGDLSLGASSVLRVSDGTTLDSGADYVLASYTGALTGTFGSLVNLPAGFQVDYSNGFIKLFVDRDEKVWTGAVNNTWDNSTANWGGAGATFSSAARDNAVFDDTAAGPTSVTVGAGGVIPGNILVSNDAKAYSITSSPGAAIGGLGGLTKSGPGTLTLSGPNTFTAQVVIGNGTVSVDALADSGAASPLGAGPEITLGTGTTTGTLAYPVGNASTDRTFNVAPGGGTVSVSGDVNFTGVISGPGTFTKAGSGKLTLSGPKVGLTGPIAVTGGTLSAGQLTSGTGALSLSNGTTFEYTGTTVTDARGVSVPTGLSATVSVNNPATTLTFTGPAAGGNFVKGGAGTLALNGLATGSVQIAQGTLALNNPANAITGNISIDPGNTLRLGAAGAGGTAGINLAGGTLDLAAGPSGATQGLTAKIYAAPPRLIGTNGANDRNPDFDSLAHLNAFAGSLTPTVTTSSTTGGVSSLAFTAATPYEAYGVNAVDNVISYFSGKIFIPVGGDVEFATSSDDGSIIAIDGKTVVNNIGFHGVERRAATVRLTPGFHDIVLGHYEGGGGQAFTASYTLPGGTEVTIPNSALFSGLPTATAYGNDVQVQSASTINSGKSVGQLGRLTISSDANLTLSGMGVQFTNTVLNGAGNFSFNGGTVLDLGVLNAPAAPVSITRTGSLAMRSGGPALAAGSTLTVNGGQLGVTAAPGSSPLGGASVTLGFDSTGLTLSSLGGDVTVDSPVTFQGPTEITAGAHNGGVAGTPGSPITVTFGGASTLTGNGSAVRLSSTDNYVLKVAGSLSGFGGVTMDGGTASIEASSAIGGPLAVLSGQLTLNGALTTSGEASVGVVPPQVVLPTGTPVVPASLVLNARLASSSLNVYGGGTATANAAGALQGATVQVIGGTLVNAAGAGIDTASSLNVSDRGLLRLAVASGPLTAAISGAGSALIGDLTNQTITSAGGPGVISMGPDTILGPTAGPEPTRAQIGGALLYQGVTALDQSLTVGDNGTSSIYKGAAFGPWLAGSDPLAFSGSISDGSAGNAGVEVQLGGRNVAVSSATTLNTSDTLKGVDFTGKGTLVIDGTPLGSASLYTRSGLPPANDLDMGTTGHAQGYYVSALNPATPAVTFGPAADALAAGKTLAVKNGAVTFTHVNNLAPGATVIVGENATVYGSGPTDGGAKLATGSLTVKAGGAVQIANEFPIVPVADFQNLTLSGGANWTFEDGAALLINADPRNTGTTNPSSINTATSAFPSNVDFVLDGAGNHVFTGNGLVLGDNRRISTSFSTNATVARGAGIHATAGTQKVFLLASSSPANAGGRQLLILDDLDLTRPGGAGVADLQVGDQNSYTTFVRGDSGERVATASGGTVRLEGATTARNGSVQSGTLRLHGGNPTFSGPLEVVNSTTTLMIDELDARLTAGNISPDIIVRDGARLQNNINTPTPAARVVVNQKFTMEGNGGGAEKLFVQRGSGTAVLGVDYTDINLMAGAAFDVDEENTDVRVSLNLHGDATARENATSDPHDFINVTAVGGPKTLTLGELAAENAVTNVFGTIGEGVTVDLIFGQLFFRAGSVLNGTVRTENAPAGGDSWIQIHNGETGVVAERITGTGVIELGNSGDQVTGEDLFGYVDEPAATGDAPLYNQIDLKVRIVSDGDPATGDGEIRSERGADRAGPAGRVRFTNVQPDAGATLRIGNNNGTEAIVDVKLQGPDTQIQGLTAGALLGHVTASPTNDKFIISGNAELRMVGTLNADADITNTSTTHTVSREAANQLGPGNKFNLNNRTLNVINGTFQVNQADPGDGTVNVFNARMRSDFGRAGAVWGDGLNVNLNDGARLTAVVDEVAATGTALVNRFDGVVNIANGAKVGIGAERGTDVTTAGALSGTFRVSTVNAGAGSTLALQGHNDQNVQIGALNMAGDLEVFSASSNANVTPSIGNITRSAGVTTNALTLGGHRLRLTGGVAASQVNINNTSTDFDPGAAATATVAGNVQVQTAMNVKTGTVDLGSNVISGKTTTVSGTGLVEGRVAGVGQTNNFNITAANPGTTFKPGAPQANIPFSNTDGNPGVQGWATHTTYIYSGEFFVPAGAGAITFGENFDDAVRVRIGTTDVVNNTAAGTPTKGTTTLAGGTWHPFEIRLGQGGGGVGGTVNDTDNWGAPSAASPENNGLGFGWDPLGRDSVDGVNFINFTADANGNLLDATGQPTGFMIRGTTTATQGNVTVDASSTLKAGAVRNINALTVNGTLQLASGGGASKVSALAVGAAGRIDLANNALVVSGGATPAAVLTSVTNLAKAGRADGAWNGLGINSSAAAADALKITGVGVAQNNDGAGAPLTPSLSTNVNDVVARFTYNGDADLSGEVTAADYMRADRGYLSNVDDVTTNDLAGWSNGDFNYDGKTNIDDFFLLDQANALQGAPIAVGGGPLSAGAPSALSASASAVPEPTALGLLGVGVAGLLRRRRRQA